MTTESLSVTIEGELLTVEIGTVAAPAGGGGTSDHGALTGLADDDHTQYHNDTRGDARYSQLGHNHSGTYEPAGAVATHAGATDPHGDRAFATSAVSTHSALTTGAHGISAAGAALIDDADAAAQRTTLGLGTAATTAATAYEASGAIATHNAVTTAHGISAYGATLVDDADASTARTTLGLGTAATSATSAFEAAGGIATHAALTTVHGISAFGATLVDDADASAARTTLGLAIGTNVQAYDADLTTWAGITPGTGVGTALGANVGSAGAFVTNGGALGTPSSGTLTNCTFPTLNQNTSGYAEALKSATTTVSVSAATAPSSGQVLTATSGTAATWQTPSGGLTGFTAAENTSSPNATVPVASLTANNAATNVDAAFKPKGTGAVLAHVPDSTATGGNKRGANAVDWQTSRGAAAQVASGTSAVIGGGSNNTASAHNATVGGGTNNTANGTNSTVGGGTTNTAGSSGTVAGGNTNTASGTVSWIPGGYQATVRGLWGAYAYSSGQRSAQGDAQVTGQPVRRTTAATTTVQLSTDGATPTSTTVLVLPNNSGGQFEARVTALQSTGAGGWKIEGTGYRGANAASTVIQGATTITAFGIVAGIGAPTVDVVADTTLGALVIQVTPANTTSTHWVGKLELIQVA